MSQKLKNYSSLMLTGYLGSLESVRQSMDRVPYERFPYCCSGAKNDFDVNLARKKDIQPVRKEPVRELPRTFWTPEVIRKYSNFKSMHQMKSAQNSYNHD